MEQLKILLISSTVPRDTSAGELVLYRHFSQFPGLSLIIASDRESDLQSIDFINLSINKVLNRLTYTRYHKWSHSFIQCFNPFFNYKKLKHYINNHNIDLILTVAEGVHWIAAMKISREFKIPLVTIFHDWWPDVASINEWARKILDKKFKYLYHQSKLVFCVSEEIQKKLGNHSNTKVLYPIPAKNTKVRECHFTANKTDFRLVYAGKLSLIYSSQISKLSKLFLSQNTHSKLQFILKFFGSHPDWSETILNKLKNKGIYGGFVSRELLTRELQNADALLVVIPFELKNYRLVKTNFPSKLVEYCQFGKPIVIWGPEYCSAVQWARKHQSALVVTSPLAKNLVSAINELKDNYKTQKKLGDKALEMSRKMFNPEIIQQKFVESIYLIADLKSD